MNEKMKIRIMYNVFAPALEDQVNSQGFTLGKKGELLQKQYDKVVAMMVAGVYEKTGEERIRRLQKRIIDACKPLKVFEPQGNAPAVVTEDREPIVKAHWEARTGIMAAFCSHCGGSASFDYPRCPWCGAHMKEGDGHEP